MKTLPIWIYIVVLILVMGFTARRLVRRGGKSHEAFHGSIAGGLIILPLEFFVITGIFFFLFPNI